MHDRARTVTAVLCSAAMLALAACSNSGSATASTTPAGNGARTATTYAGRSYTTDEPVSAPGVTSTEIDVGSITSKTNPLGTNNSVLDDGIKGYFDLVNAKGGVWGRKLKLSTELDDQTVDNLNVTQQLLSQNNVYAVFEAVELFSGAKLLAKAGIPTFGWNINAEWAGPPNFYPNIAPICFSKACSSMGKALPWIIKQVGAHKVALIGYNVPQSADAMTSGAAEITKFSQQADAKVVYADTSLQFGQTDYSVQVSKMKSSGADFLVTALDFNGDYALAKEMQKQGILDKVTFFHPNLYDAAFVQKNASLFENGLVLIPILALIVLQIRRMAHRTPIFSYAILACAAGGPTIFLMADLFWLLAAFRPTRDPQLTLMFNDLAWVTFSSQVGFLIAQSVILALAICLVILMFITLVNLRGVRETGAVFIIPTYLFVGSLFVTLALGLFKTLLTGGHPSPVVAPPALHPQTAVVSAWLLLKAFSSGCTAMTGVEAVSNGVKAFREPVVKSAQRALTAIIALLIAMLAGIAYLVRVYSIGATDPGAAGYQSVLSQLVAAVAGQGVFYYVTIGSILLVLALSANTAFADFPRLCRAVAEDGYLPQGFATRGRRLVYSQGIWVLAVLCAGLLILFGGVTDRLIPLFAVGAFLAFTLSQAGMVAHWKRTRGEGWRHSMLVNGLGAVATATTVVVVTVSKFVAGAWVTALLIPAMMIVMISIRRHYLDVEKEIESHAPLDLDGLRHPLVVVPVLFWNQIAQKGLRFALNLSSEVLALHIQCDKDTGDIRHLWSRYVEDPARRAGLNPPRLVVLPSPYRFVISPILDYILQLERDHPDRQIAVLIPELVERHWYHSFLHNQRAEWLRALLLAKSSQRTILVNVPWHLST